MSTICHPKAELEAISRLLRERPLAVLREMLPDRRILDACRQAGYTRFRRRQCDPVVTVFHLLTQAIQREDSCAATWADLWGAAAGATGLRFSDDSPSRYRANVSLMATVWTMAGSRAAPVSWVNVSR